MTRVLILYWSSNGNTKKVAYALKEGLEAAGATVSILKTTEESDIDYFD